MMNLKRCPFCGGEAEIVSYWSGSEFFNLNNDRYVVRCKKCGVETPEKKKDKRKAAEMWNRRSE